MAPWLWSAARSTVPSLRSPVKTAGVHSASLPLRTTTRCTERRPTADQLDAFLIDRAPDKRPNLVRQLLADRRGYADPSQDIRSDIGGIPGRGGQHGDTRTRRNTRSKVGPGGDEPAQHRDYQGHCGSLKA